MNTQESLRRCVFCREALSLTDQLEGQVICLTCQNEEIAEEIRICPGCGKDKTPEESHWHHDDCIACQEEMNAEEEMPKCHRCGKEAIPEMMFGDPAVCFDCREEEDWS
jgi:hypothetical protein